MVCDSRSVSPQNIDVHSLGTSTGISAHDRALTAQKLASPFTRPDEFNRPGHLCPLRARDGGVFERRGHTESGLGTNFVPIFTIIPVKQRRHDY